MIHRATPLTYDPTSDVIQTVFDIDGVVSSVFGVSVPFYVQVTSESETGVLNREDTLAALQVHSSSRITHSSSRITHSSSRITTLLKYIRVENAR